MAQLLRLLSYLLFAMALPGFLPGGASVVSAQSAQTTVGTTIVAESDWQPNEDDSWLFEIRTGRWTLGDGVRGYQTADGVCVDLADTIMALDISVRLDKKLRRATGWAFDERNTLEIDRERGRAVFGGRVETLSPDMIHDTPEGWCVALEPLSRWLGVGLTSDLSNSTIVLKSEKKLPFELQNERKERAARIRPKASFDLATLPQATRGYKFFQAPSVDVAYSTAYFHTPSQGDYKQARFDILASGEVGKASFDARLSSDDKLKPNSAHLTLYRSDPRGKLLGPLKATHVAAGDINMMATPLVSSSVTGRGAVVTNRPLEQPDSFDRTSFRGELPTGWDAELYRNGQLLAFASPGPDGRYNFLDVPLLYGMNQFEVILYGPQGQMKREFKNVPVGIDSIPPGKTFYWAGVAQEGHDLISLRDYKGPYQRGWRWSLGAEHGLNNRTSVAAYAHSLMIENERYNYLEAAVRRALGPGLLELSASGETKGGFGLRGQYLAQFGTTYVRAESMWAYGGYRSDRFDRYINNIHSLSVDRSVRLGSMIVPMHASVEYLERRDGEKRLEVAGRASASLRALALTGELRWRKSMRDFGPVEPDQVTAALLANARIGKLLVRGEARMAVKGNDSEDKLNVVGEWIRGENTNWRAELTYEPNSNRIRGGIGLTRHFRQISFTTVVEAASDGSFGARLNAAFSLGPNPRGHGVRMSREKLASQGQAMGLVFRDNNGDGVRNPDEPVEKNVYLTAGNAVSADTTDAGGRAMIESLTPYRPVMIGVDSGSLSDPFVQPSIPGKVIVPRPGVVTVVELPLVAAGEVEGTLVSMNGSPLSGVDLELLDSEGRVRGVARTEFDGFFLFESVPYGRFTVRVSALSAQAVKVAPQLDVVAILNDANPRAKLGQVKSRSTDVIAKADEAEGHDKNTVALTEPLH